MELAVEWFSRRISHGGLVTKKQFNELLEEAKNLEIKQRCLFANDYADQVMAGMLNRAEVYHEQLKTGNNGY